MTSGKWKGKSATTRREELPSNWDELREAQFKADNYQCTARLPSGTRCPSKATDCDHVGSKWDHTRLTSLCALHHGKKTARQGTKGRPPLPKRRVEKNPFAR